MANTISVVAYRDALRVLKTATDALDPRELVLKIDDTDLSSLEGDRARVVASVQALKNTVADAYAAALLR